MADGESVATTDVVMGAVLAVHGGFVGGRYWDDVVALLAKNGHDVRAIEQLPSTGSDDPARLGDLATDVACARARPWTADLTIFS